MNLEKSEISEEKKLANGEEKQTMAHDGELGKAGERGGGIGGYGGAGGRGGGKGNGNGNGNGKGVVTQWIPSVVMVLGLFGFWWATADPKARLDKIEANQADNRKELNEAITSLRKEGVANYVSLREHLDLVSRFKNELDHLEKKDESFLTKAQFEAWKTERDLYISSLVKRIDFLRDEILSVIKSTAGADETKMDTYQKANEKAYDQANLRMDRMQLFMDRNYEKLLSDIRSFTERVDRQDTPLGKRVEGIDTRLTVLTDHVNSIQENKNKK